MDSNFRAFWLAPVTWNILGYSLFCKRREKWCIVSRKFQKKKLWPLMKWHFFYPSDLVNTKTTIPVRVGEERWIYTETRSVEVYIHPLFTSPSGDSCILVIYFIGYHWTAYTLPGFTLREKEQFSKRSYESTSIEHFHKLQSITYSFVFLFINSGLTLV